MNVLQIRSGISQWDYNRGMIPTFSFGLHIGGFGQDILDELSLTKVPYVPTKGDKIYFLPSVNVPRVKFKNVCVEHNIKNVRDFTQATVYFGSKKSLNEMTNTHWLYKCPTKYFVALFDLVKDKMDAYDVEKTETALEYYTEEFVALDNNLIQIITQEESLITDDDFGYSENLMTVKEEYQELYKYLKDKVILDESCVINVLNGEDATEIDQNMYNHLCEMFDSSDTDNHVLAMEIMANSKYVESLVYLELLFYKYSFKMHERNTKNHVNFKSLISYLDKHKPYMSTDIDDIGKSLIDKDQFTTDKIDIVMDYLSDDIKLRGSTKYFTVKSVTVHPDFAHVLNKNYTYEVQEDFVPTVAEIPVVEEAVEEIPVQVEAVTEESESEFAAEDNFEEEVEWPVEEAIFTEEQDEAIGEAIAAIEEATAILEERPVSNNNQIETNGTDDFGWF